jgi:hypothetical protein
VAVFARPPVVFYLFGQGRQPDLLGNLDVLDSAVVQPPRYLVVDSAILRDNPIAAEVLGRASPQLIVREKVPYRVTAPVLLDDWGWSGISAPVPESLFLYEVSQHRPDRLE